MAVLAVHRRHPVAGRRADVPRRRARSAVLATIWAGGAQVVAARRSIPAACSTSSSAHGVTATLVVPTMMAALAEEQLARPRDVVVAALALPRRRRRSRPSCCAARTPRSPRLELLHIYGRDRDLADRHRCCPTSSGCSTPRGPARAGGRRSASRSSSSTRPSAPRCRAGEVGEVMIRGANVMPATGTSPRRPRPRCVDGWYQLRRPRATSTTTGYLFLVDRAKDMIVSAARTCTAPRSRTRCTRTPRWSRRPCSASRDERWGEAVHAVVVLRAEPAARRVTTSSSPTAARRSRATRCPSAIEIRDRAAARSRAPGKILKRELRAVFWADRESQLT